FYTRPVKIFLNSNSTLHPTLTICLTMKTILVPTDFSKAATNALNYAAALAKKENGRIILLHVYNFVYVSPVVTTAYTSHQIQIAELEIVKQLKTACFGISEKVNVKC